MFNIYGAPRTGGSLTVYKVDSRGQLALDGSRIYMVTHPRFGSTLWSIPIPRDSSDAVNLQISNVVAGPVVSGDAIYAGMSSNARDGGMAVAFLVGPKMPKHGDDLPSIISVWDSSGGVRLVLHSGNLFVRGGGVWRIPLDGTDPQLLWATSSNGDIDANGGHVYWTQNPVDGYPGCLGRANLDGTDGQCIDQGDHQYGGVRVDDTSVFFIRDGQILQLPR